jgi:nucleoside-diphosphate-sugar epimerase
MATTVALTGGTGFIGAHLARRMVDAGYRVRALVRRPEMASRLAAIDACLVPGSLDDRESLLRLVADCDAVVHCAGAIKALNVEEFDRINRGGTEALVDAVVTADHRPRLVLMSSLAARSPTVSPYAASKRRSEIAVERRGAGLRWTALRPPIVYGPGDRETFVMFRAARLGIVPMMGPRDARISFIHVDDLADAVITVLGAERDQAGVYEVHDGEPGGYGWAAIAEAIGRAVGRRLRPLPVPRMALAAAAATGNLLQRALGRPMMLTPMKLGEISHPDWACRDSGLEEAIGWRPKRRIEEGFRDAVAWYRSQGWLA